MVGIFRGLETRVEAWTGGRKKEKKLGDFPNEFNNFLQALTTLHSFYRFLTFLETTQQTPPTTHHQPPNTHHHPVEEVEGLGQLDSQVVPNMGISSPGGDRCWCYTDNKHCECTPLTEVQEAYEGGRAGGWKGLGKTDRRWSGDDAGGTKKGLTTMGKGSIEAERKEGRKGVGEGWCGAVCRVAVASFFGVAVVFLVGVIAFVVVVMRRKKRIKFFQTRQTRKRDNLFK